VIGLDDAVHRRAFDCIGSDPRYGLTPGDIKKAYNLDGLTLDGTGQTLAIASTDDYADSDITSYENCFGLPHVPLQKIPISGGASRTVGECTLDIEMAVAIAPQLDKILIYQTAPDSPSTLAMLATIALDNAAKQVSISWGAREDSLSDQERDSENNDFMWMAAQGQSVYVAAGDSGTGIVNDPASQPYVVGVGGTSLGFDKDSGWVFELAWENQLGGAAGGGGVSTVWPLPNYQPTFVSPGSNGSATHRNVPDVSLNADPLTGYAFYYSGRFQNRIGGTSAAAPLWAAFTALANQQRAINGAGPLGFPNPALYYLAHTSRYAEDFHDITEPNLQGPFPVVRGYDNVTGLGTFNGANLLNDLRIDAAALHVDGNFLGDLQNGTAANPFKTVTAAVNAASPNLATLIYIKANTYPEKNMTFNKHVLLVNDGDGLVIIGQ
jgi:kumamolisin